MRKRGLPGHPDPDAPHFVPHIIKRNSLNQYEVSNLFATPLIFGIRIPSAIMSRPKLNTGDVRSVNFTVRLTDSELKKLERLSEITGRTTADLMREKLFKGKFPDPKLARVDLNTFLELKKIGVNLNQLTRLAHTNRIGMDMMVTLMQLLQQQEKIFGKLLYHDS